MIKLFEAKQVGTVSYMVASIETLLHILEDNKILRSREAELNPNTKKKQFYLSLSRNLTATAKRNPKRWKFGVVLDGDKLSNKYAITPVSFAGISMTYSDLRVKYITAYDNDTYVLNLVNWPTITISKSLWDSITKEIENMSEELKQKKKLMHTMEGSRVVNGRKVREKYLFNVKSGGLRLNFRKYPEICTELSKNNSVNESEERIWIPTNKLFIDITGCIQAIILPKDISTENEPDYEELQSWMNENNFDSIITY